MTDDKQKWSYLAGILDGEGYIGASINMQYDAEMKKRYRKSDLQVVIVNTSLLLMKWLIINFGGVYYTRKLSEQSMTWRDTYSWRPKGKTNKVTVLLGTLPYLLIKREQAKLGLEFLRLEGFCPDARIEVAERLYELNDSKGPRAKYRRGVSVTTNTLDTSSGVKIESDLTGDRESALPVMAVA